MISPVRVRIALLLSVVSAGVAEAQGPDPAFRPKHVVASAGLFGSSGLAVGDVTAELRRNAIGTPSPFTLLRAESEFDRTMGADVRVAVALTRLLAVEVGGTYAKPNLAIAVSQDVEAGAVSSIAGTTTQYTVDVSGLYQVPRVKWGSRIRPYVIGGGGYLRQLHEGRLRVETGHTIHLGGGIRYWISGGQRTRRAVGARVEARMIRRSGGIEFDERRHIYPAFSLLGFVGL